MLGAGGTWYGNLVSLETRGQKSLHAGPALHSRWCSFVPLGAANTLASCREPRGHAGFYLEGSRPGAGASGRRRRGTGNAERYAHERLGAHRSSDTAPADGQPGPPAPALGHRDPPTPAVGPPRRTQAPVPGATAARRGDAERGSRRRGAPAGARAGRARGHTVAGSANSVAATPATTRDRLIGCYTHTHTHGARTRQSPALRGCGGRLQGAAAGARPSRRPAAPLREAPRRRRRGRHRSGREDPPHARTHARTRARWDALERWSTIVKICTLFETCHEPGSVRGTKEQSSSKTRSKVQHASSLACRAGGGRWTMAAAGRRAVRRARTLMGAHVCADAAPV